MIQVSNWCCVMLLRFNSFKIIWLNDLSSTTEENTAKPSTEEKTGKNCTRNNTRKAKETHDDVGDSWMFKWMFQMLNMWIQRSQTLQKSNPQVNYQLLKNVPVCQELPVCMNCSDKCKQPSFIQDKCHLSCIHNLET